MTSFGVCDGRALSIDCAKDRRVAIATLAAHLLSVVTACLPNRARPSLCDGCAGLSWLLVIIGAANVTLQELAMAANLARQTGCHSLLA